MASKLALPISCAFLAAEIDAPGAGRAYSGRGRGKRIAIAVLEQLATRVLDPRSVKLGSAMFKKFTPGNDRSAEARRLTCQKSWIHDPIMLAGVLRQIALEHGPPRRTASQYVLGALRDAIATGVLKEGEPVPQNEIAEALNVSRMPVREALRLLEAEGWVDFSPHRGAVVAVLSIEDVREVFKIRFALESLALQESVPIVEDMIFDRAAAILDEMDGEAEIGRWVNLNRRFHLTLYAGANARLISLIESQYNAVDRYLRIELAEMHNAQESQDEHRAILAACRDRDVARAIALNEPHIYEAGLDLANALNRRRGTQE